MLKIEVNDNQMRIGAGGTFAEIASDLVRSVHELRNEIISRDGGYVFDLFLKEVFADLVIAGDDLAKVTDILAESLERMSEK